jgi:hypothetical protein
VSLALAVKHLLACGASNEAVVRFIEEAESASKTRERDRKRAYRERMLSPDGRDNGTTPPLSPPMINNSTPLIPTPKTIKSTTDEPLFEGFWAAYPKKVGKGAARKAYRNALKRAFYDEILAGAKAYAASKPDPQFTAHASTWLNADRWLDEPERKPSANVVGFRKELPPEPPRKPRTPEEQAEIDAKLKGLLKARTL